MSNGPATFTVSLKVGGDNVKLLIAVGESTDEVFQRLRTAYPTCSNRKTQILEKLVASLRLQLHNRAINSSLLHSISSFLESNHQEIPRDHPTSHSPHPTSHSPHPTSHTSHTPPHNSAKMGPPSQALQLIEQNRQGQKTAFKKRLSYQSQKQQDSHLPVKKGSVPAKPKQSTPGKLSKLKQVGDSAERAKRCNPDIIKACELIMKKTQNTEMKLMAKEFLKEKGYLKEEKQKCMMSQKKKKYTLADWPQDGPKIEASPCLDEKDRQSQHEQASQEKCQASAIVADMSGLGVRRQNNRFGKYKYLQSSLANESLSMDYQSLHRQTDSSTVKQGEGKAKRYSYLE